MVDTKVFGAHTGISILDGAINAVTASKSFSQEPTKHDAKVSKARKSLSQNKQTGKRIKTYNHGFRRRNHMKANQTTLQMRNPALKEEGMILNRIELEIVDLFIN